MPTQRYQRAYDDMHVDIRSSLSGASQWSEAAVVDSGFIMGRLVNGTVAPANDDYIQFKGECEHSKELGVDLGDIHMHYINETAINLNETLVWELRYCWLKFGDILPAAAAWTLLTGSNITMIMPATAAKTYGIIQFATSGITAPTNETYGSTLLVKLWRRQGTYTGVIAVVDAGAHQPVNRNGSLTAASD